MLRQREGEGEFFDNFRLSETNWWSGNGNQQFIEIKGFAGPSVKMAQSRKTSSAPNCRIRARSIALPQRVGPLHQSVVPQVTELVSARRLPHHFR